MNESKLAHIGIGIIFCLILWIGYIEIRQIHVMSRLEERVQLQSARMNRVIDFIVKLDEDIRVKLLSDEPNIDLSGDN